MVLNILGQMMYQVIVIAWIIFKGEDIFEAPVGRQLGNDAEPTKHYTILFQVFIMMQVFNEIGSRKLSGELNVFAGFFSNSLFLGVIIFTIVMQYGFVELGGSFFHVRGLSLEEHFACI